MESQSQPATGRTLTLRIEGLANDGRGVARTQGEGSLVAFVQRALPGQTVRARVTRTRKNMVWAETEEVLEPSGTETEAPCPHFPACGGCSFMNLEYQEQLAWKERFVKDALVRIAKEEDPRVAACLPSPQTVGHRNKMSFSFAGGTGPGLHLGLHGLDGRVMETTDCRICPAEVMDILASARELARQSRLPAWNPRTSKGYLRHLVVRHFPGTGQSGVHLVTAPGKRAAEAVEAMGKTLLEHHPHLVAFQHSLRFNRLAVAEGERLVLSLGEDHLEEKVGEAIHHIGPDSFFQTNSPLLPDLLRTALEVLAPRGGDVVYDVYCGTGLFSRFLAPAAKEVHGFEIRKESVELARQSALLAGLENLRFHQGPAGKLAETARILPRPNAVLVDPPRSGLDPATVAALLELSPTRILAVSCNPPTLARDISALGPYYSLHGVTPIDLYPHSPHVECLALLTRNQARTG